MQALWGLQQLGMTFELKGGTSLSKGFGLIHRFSVIGRLLARAVRKCAKAKAAFEDGALKEIAHELETKRPDRQ